MANYNFSDDLSVAQKTENEVGELLKNLGMTILGYNNDNRYDIKVSRKGSVKTIEIKEDFLCQDTGNVAVEFKCRGNDSGIAATEADFYLYKVHEIGFQVHYYLIKTEDLKKLIKEKFYHRIVNGGDANSDSMNYLFFLSTIKSNSLLLK